MTSYLVKNRLTMGDGHHFPGEVLVDPEGADILLARDLIMPVPEDYKSPKSSKAAKPEEKTEEATDNGSEPPTVEQLLEAGYSPKAAALLAQGKTNVLVDNETALIERAMAERPDAIKLAAAVDSSLGEVMELSDDEYDEAVQALVAADPGTVGAAEDK